MTGFIEKSYGKVFKAVLGVVNPVKKIIVKTECKVHKFINKQAVIILKNDGYKDAYALYKKHIEDLNSGVVWADQDLKSSNHFYNPRTGRGLYGSSNALKECITYYTAAITWWHKGDIRKAMFYLGAACHLIQDTTVPQHVNVKLLKNHRKYEKWVVKAHQMYNQFKCFDGGIYISSIKGLIEENAWVAIKTYNSNENIVNLEKRFFNITDIVLCQAQRSTAGMLRMFYEAVCSMDEKSKECIA